MRFDEAIDAADLGASEEVLLEVEKRDDEARGPRAPQAKMFMPIDEEQQRHVSSVLGKQERLVDTRKKAADPSGNCPEMATRRIVRTSRTYAWRWALAR